MPRYRLLIEYFGGSYYGWQSQKDGRGVQDAIENAILKLKENKKRLQCAGRTDAGVHALGQVAHVDLDKEWDCRILRNALNAHLLRKGQRVAILDVSNAPLTFDARFSAIRRHYFYRILNRKTPSALEYEMVWHVPQKLDIAAMQYAAQSILGKHDFTTFRASSCQAKSPIRTLERFDVIDMGSDEIRIEVSARSFLHHQVRSFVGSLVKIGNGSWPITRMYEILKAEDRTKCGPVAPAFGLYFEKVDY